MTTNEIEMIKAIVDSEYNSECDPAGCTWSWSVCGNKSKAAVLGSLVKKGLAWQQAVETMPLVV